MLCRGDAGASRLLEAPSRRGASPPAGQLIAAMGEPNGTGDTVRGGSGNDDGEEDRCGAAGDRNGGVRKLNLETNGCDGEVGRLRCRL